MDFDLLLLTLISGIYSVALLYDIKILKIFFIKKFLHYLIIYCSDRVKIHFSNEVISSNKKVQTYLRILNCDLMPLFHRLVCLLILSLKLYKYVVPLVNIIYQKKLNFFH